MALAYAKAACLLALKLFAVRTDTVIQALFVLTDLKLLLSHAYSSSKKRIMDLVITLPVGVALMYPRAI